MADFWIFFEYGFRYILNLFSYYSILFLILLTIPYLFKDWQKLILLITFVTLGFCMAILLSIFGVLFIKGNLVQFLIPTTILLTALITIFKSNKSSKQDSISLIGVISLFFGIFNGLSYATHFNSLKTGTTSSKIIPLLEFSLGIQLGQIAVAVIVLLLSSLIQSFFRFSRRDIVLVFSSFIIGVVLPIIIASEIWKK